MSQTQPLTKAATSAAEHQVDDASQARYSVYQLLSTLFAKEVDQPIAADLTSPSATAFWLQLASEPSFKTDVETLQATLQGLSSKEDYLELAADYCSLFLVGGKNNASPYASLYIEGATKETLIFGEQHQQISQFLNNCDLGLNSQFKEPADHIAVILAFSAQLCLAAPSNEQLIFIRDYLANWLPAFSAQVHVIDSKQQGFYRALVDLTLHWVESDIHWLSEELKA